MKRVLLLTDTIYDFYNGGQKVGGIAVQMSLWAKVFQSHGWRVYSLSQDTEITQNDVTFVKYPRIGGFFGIFVGCLAIALAEVLDGIPIFTRRMRLRKGLNTIMISVALGKMAGALLFFIAHFW